MAERKENTDGQFKQFWITWRGWTLLVLFLLAVVVALVVLVLTGVLETGFEEYSPPAAGTARAKTLWDLMDLLLVPLMLALGAGFFTWVTNKREHEIAEQRAMASQKAADQRAQTEREIALDRTREAAYQGYLDRMAELIANGLFESAPDDAKRSIARARTLTVLRQLDGERRGLLLSFLGACGMIRKKLANSPHDWYARSLSGRSSDQIDSREESPLVDLSGEDLRGTKAPGANLSVAALQGVDLSASDLSRCSLRAANLIGANLRGTNLSQATLVWAGLGGADLRGADLTGTSIALACLHGSICDEGTLLDPMARVIWEIISQPKANRQLRGIELPSACLVEAFLEGAELQEANLMAVRFNKANLSAANLSKSTLTSANFTGADLAGANLAGADLRAADFTEADLTGATLRQATFQGGESFAGATLTNADLTGTRVTDGQLDRAASLEGATMPDGTKHVSNTPTQAEQPDEAEAGAEGDSELENRTDDPSPDESEAP